MHYRSPQILTTVTWARALEGRAEGIQSYLGSAQSEFLSVEGRHHLDRAPLIWGAT